jgi:beta-glucosidase
MEPKRTATHRNSTASAKARAHALVSQMTLEEKVSQMVYDTPAIERLGIPAYNWWNECLHGVGRAGVATVFPQAIGLGATWNPDLLDQVAMAISDEGRAKHHEADRRGIGQIYTGLTFWSPNINIFRDPRWGRGQETYGEDPYLTARMGVSFVQGLQGDHPDYLKLVATPKHFAVHSGPESDRHRFDARVGERDLRETYLPAFEACVREGKAASVMGAYSRLNGEPCCASPTLLEQILRGEWAFDGYVVSDCEAIRDIYQHHKVVETPEAAAALAVKHGCELNCGSVYPALLEAVAHGLISEETIARAVERLFTSRFRLGMFDPPEQVPYTQIPYEIVDSPEHQVLALQAARESIVLLKNEGGLLPLTKNLTSIAVVGPNADDLLSLLGNYNGTPTRAVTPLEGIRSKVSPSTVVYHAHGCDFADAAPSLQVIPTASLRPAEASAGESGLSGTYYASPAFEGQPALQRVDRVVDFVWQDTTPLMGQGGEGFSVRWTGFLVPPTSGTYSLGVRGFNAFRLLLEEQLIAERDWIHHPVIRTKELVLEAGRLYRLRLDYISRGLDPQVQLLWARPDVENETVALEVAAKTDVIVAVMGLSPNLEGEEMPVTADGFLVGDRTEISLPSSQLGLLRKLQALGKPLVLVLLNGSAVALPWAAEHVPAIVEAWYPGQAGGKALADVLFGDYNPGGRLPVTFYRSVDDLPSFDNYAMEGRTYRYFRGEPLFAFGHGLSYTTFEFGDLQIRPAQAAIGGQVAVSVCVTNTGERAGDEVVQLYVRQPDAAVPRPIQELKGFTRVHLGPGERKTVTFTLHSHQLGYYDEGMRYAVQPGTVEVLIGRSSRDLPLVGHFEIVGSPTEVSKVFFSHVKVR